MYQQSSRNDRCDYLFTKHNSREEMFNGESIRDITSKCASFHAILSVDNEVLLLKPRQKFHLKYH